MDEHRGGEPAGHAQRRPAAQRPEDRLAALGLELPELSLPRGTYVRARRHGDLVFLAGHGPAPDADGRRPSGRVGGELSLEEGYAAARRAGLGLLATLKTELGELSRVTAVLRVLGMVQCAPGFDATPKVIDGCSDLLVEVLGPEVGRHARSAIGVEVLPFGLPVEIEAVVAVR
jgi:enamine deaminase RidA (YjgF/YER057c/UK114 family)